MGASRDEILRILLRTEGEQDVAGLRKAIQGLGDVSDETKTQLQAMVDSIAGNNQQQAAIAAYQALEDSLVATAAKAQQARAEFDRLGTEFTETAEPSAKLAADFQRASDALTRLEADQRKLGQQLRIAGSDLKAAGVDTGKLAQEQDRLRAASARTEGEIRKLAAATQQGTSRFQGFFAALNQSRAALLGATVAFAGISRAFGNAARESTRFQQSVAEIGTLLRDQSGLPSITRDLQNLALQFGGDVNEKARAYYGVISAGAKEGADANAILAASNRLAVAGLADLGVSADAVTTFLNAYKLEASEADRVAGSLFGTVRSGKTTMEELGQSIGQVIPIAAAAGVEYDELNAAIAALTLAGVKPAQAVTQLRAVIQSVLKPTNEAALEARNLGIEFNAAALRAKGLGGLLTEVRAAAGDNEQAFTRLFGSVEAFGAAVALSGTQAADFARITAELGTSAQDLEQAFARIDETPAQRFQRFSAAAQILKAQLGDLVVSALLPLADALAKGVQAFTGLPEGLQSAAVGGTAFLAVATPLAIVLPKLAVGFRALLGPIGLISTALGAAAAAWAAFGRSVERLPPAATEAARALRDLKAASEENRLAAIEAVRGALRNAEATLALKDAILEQVQAEEGLTVARLQTIRQSRELGIAEQARLAAAEATIAGATRQRDAQRELVQSLREAHDAQRALITPVRLLNEQLDKQTGITAAAKGALADLGVSANAVGEEFTETGRKVLAQLDAIRGDAAVTATAVSAAFETGLSRLATLPELERFQQALKGAFDEGRISGQRYFELLDQIKGRKVELREELDRLKGGLRNLGDSDAPAKLGGQVANLRDQVQGVGEEAAKTGQMITEGFDRGGAAGSLANIIAAVRSEFEATSDAAAKFFDNVLGQATRTGRTVEEFFRAIREAQTATRQAIEEQTQAALNQANAYANLSDRLIERLLQTGQTAEKLEAAASRVGDKFTLLGDQQLAPLRSALASAAGQLRQIENDANNALASLEALNREEQKAALRRSGDERKLRELEFQERLREIDRLAETAGARGRQQAEEARRRARENHEAELREIEERARAEKRSAQETRRERERPAAGGSSGGVPAGVGGGGAGTTVNINLPGVGSFQVGVRGPQDAGILQRVLEELTRARRNSGFGGSPGA